jgi:ABC-2 type transport system permease protein
MTWRDVARRDLVSVARTRTGPAVVALAGLSTVVAVALMALLSVAPAAAGLAGLLGVLAVFGLAATTNPRVVAAAVGALAALAVAATLLAPPPEYGGPPEGPQAVLVVGSLLGFLVPLVGLLGGYAALVGERETGSVRFLMGLPNTRDDAYLGKFCSRAAVVVVPLVVGLLLAAVAVALTFEDGSVLPLLGVAVVTVPYAVLFVGVGLTASALADSSARAVAAVAAVFAVLRAGWPALQWLGMQGVEDPYPRPEWYFWLGRCNPMNAYVKLTAGFADLEYGHPLLSTPAADVAGSAAGSLPTTAGFAAVVLLAWTVVAPLAGLLYFRERDLL